MPIYDWTKVEALPRKDLQAWHQYKQGATGNDVYYDDSGNGRNVAAGGATTTSLQENIINGQPGMYFPGTQLPLVYNGSFQAQHLFCVCSYEDATFSSTNGILSAPSVYGIFVGGGAGTNKLFDFGGSYTYKKNDVTYISSNLLAPMSQTVSILEMQFAAPITMNGIQIGKHHTAGTEWKGYFIEDFIYSTLKNQNERKRIYEYLAMRYMIWRKNSDGLNIFPFVADKVRSAEREREHYLSEPYSGPKKALIREIKRDYQLPFALRHQAEFDAAESFHEQHYPLTNFVYEDYRYYPFRNRTLNFTSSLKEQGSEVSYRFNYSFDAEESV